MGLTKLPERQHKFGTIYEDKNTKLTTKQFRYTRRTLNNKHQLPYCPKILIFLDVFLQYFPKHSFK